MSFVVYHLVSRPETKSVNTLLRKIDLNCRHEYRVQ